MNAIFVPSGEKAGFAYWLGIVVRRVEAPPVAGIFQSCPPRASLQLV